MFKLVYKNRKGFSVIELIVATAIVGLVVGLAGGILYQLTNFFNMSSHRWKIQNAVQLACNKFETNRDSLVFAYEADLLYDPVVAEGIKITETDESGKIKKWQWKSGLNGGRLASYILPLEGNADGKYTYIFSTPVYDKDDRPLGYYLFIRDFDQGYSTLFLDNEGFGEVPVKIVFSMGTDNAEYELVTDGSGATAPSEKVSTRDDEYISHTINISIQSGLEDVTEYKVNTKYTLENIERSGKKINFNAGNLVYEAGWKDEKGFAGPAGWIKTEINSPDKGFPSTNKTSITGSEVIVTTLEKEANIMRFVSPKAHFAQGNTEDNTMGIDLASCVSTWVMNGSNMADRVLDNLRNFRDNVLRGTEFGEWFIDQYYNVWSPFLIKNTEFLKPVYRAILVPISYICNFIAEL